MALALHALTRELSLPWLDMSLLIVLHTKTWNWSNHVEEDTPIEIPLSSQDKPNPVSDFSTNLRYMVSVLR